MYIFDDIIILVIWTRLKMGYTNEMLISISTIPPCYCSGAQASGDPLKGYNRGILSCKRWG